MPFSDFAKVRNVRPEISLDGDGITFDEEELTAALGKLDKLDIFNLATPTSTECPEEEPMMDFLEEDEKEAENLEEDVQPIISSASAIRRCRLREHRREMVREYLTKHGFRDANQPKSTHSSFFRTETIYPIHHAAKLGHHLMVRELLRFGVDREVTTSRGRTAYDLAAEANKFDSHRMAAADLEMALTSLFSEVGSVVHIPDSRGGEPLLALLRRRASSEISLAGTDFTGLYKANLGMEALQKLRQDAGMAEFAWRTFLQLLSSALHGQEGCATAASSCAAGKRLELRFRLESAVLAAHLDLEAIASMPSSTEAQGFLKGLRGFVLDALAAESSAEAAKDSSKSLERESEADQKRIMVESIRRRGETQYCRRFHTCSRNWHQPFVLAPVLHLIKQLSRHAARLVRHLEALRPCTMEKIRPSCFGSGEDIVRLRWHRHPQNPEGNGRELRCPVANSMALYTTQQLLLSVWDEVYVEAVLLLCFCIGFFLIRIAQRKLVRPFSEMKRSPKGEAKCRMPASQRCQRSDSPLQPLPQLQIALDEQNANVAAEAASALLLAASPPPPSDLASLFELLRRSRGPEGAAKMLKRLPQGTLTIRSITVLAQGAALARDGAALLEVARVSRESVHLPPGCCEALLRGFASCGDAAGHREASEALLANLCPSEAFLCGLLALCATSQAVRLAEQFASFGVARYGPCLPLYSSLLKVYSQAKLWDKACDLHADFLKAGIAPDTATYGALIKAAVEGGHQSLARHLFQESKNPDVMNVMSMIRSAGRDRNIAKALSLLAELQGTSELDATTYNCALEACVACGDRKAAEDLMQNMTKAGHVDVVSYNTYVKLLLAVQDHTQVKITLEDMRSRGIQPNVVTYNSLIKASQQNPRQSWRLVQEMQGAGLEPDAFTCSILAAGLRHSPTSQGLDQILELMFKGGIVLDEVLLNCLLDVCIRLKDPSRLPELLRRWETTGLAPSPHACVMLMRAHGHARNLPEAWRLWRRLLDEDTMPTEDAFMSMVDACLATSDVKAALRVFKESRAFLAGFPRAAVAFALAVKAATASQQLTAAVELYEETKGALRLTAVTYNTLIDALVRAGDLKRAMQLFRDMACQDTGPDLISFSILIKGFASSGDLETAILLMGQMQGQGIQPDSILFNSILHGCARSQRRALTEEVLADMEKAGVAPSNFTVSILVKLYGRCGDLPAALEVIEDYPKRFGFRLNTQAYTCLMSTCIWSGDLPKAFDAYQRMLEDGMEADGKTFETLLSGCVKFGEAIRASQVLADALSCSVRLNRETLESAVVMAHNRNPDVASEMISRMTQAGLQPSGRLVATMAREPCGARGGRRNTRGWKKSAKEVC
ncbi:unnamed protein product [Symbiodinium sp. CCMP2456]|nr:unnamed protein product [Symbiodinium sp. CCMP2456]